MGGETVPEPLITAGEIASRVEQMAQTIAADLPSDFVMVVLLKGGFVFAADLLRALGRHGGNPEVDFYQLSSYGSGTESSGIVKEVSARPKVAGKSVLIVDDILDTGRCARFAIDKMKEEGATDVRLCVLLDKPARRSSEIAADYIGFKVPDRFVVGYGIDHAERWRHLCFVGAMD